MPCCVVVCVLSLTPSQKVLNCLSASLNLLIFFVYQMFENNMEKERAGAACACWPSADPLVPGRVFFAGGIDDAGVTDNVEMWGADPLKRRGQPCFKMSNKKSDVGGTTCNGYLVCFTCQVWWKVPSDLFSYVCVLIFAALLLRCWLVERMARRSTRTSMFSMPRPTLS